TMTQIRSQGVTVLLVEQDVHAALSVADRGYVMETAEIVREGTAKELENDPEVQRAYLGEITVSTVTVVKSCARCQNEHHNRHQWTGTNRTRDSQVGHRRGGA